MTELWVERTGVRRYTGRKVTAEDFRSVRTVGDLTAVIERLQQEPA